MSMKNVSAETGKRKELCHYFIEPIDKEQSSFRLTSLCDNDGTEIKKPRYRKNLEMFMCGHHYRKIIEVSI